MIEVNTIDPEENIKRIQDIHTNQIGGSDGSDLFQQLLLTELQFQDPLNPVENKEMVSQLAQLNSLQELQSLNKNISNLIDDKSLGNAANLIGKTVVGFDRDAKEQASGVVKGAFLESGELYLDVSGKRILFEDLVSVNETPVPVTNNQTQ